MIRIVPKDGGRNLTDDQRRLIEGWMLAWLQAAELQHKRVDPRRGGTFAAGQVDGMLFASALAGVETAAARLLGESHPALAAFRDAVPSFRAIRDMTVHFDDYVHNAGRLQRSGVIQGFNVFSQRDADSVTLHVDGLSMRVADAFEAALELHRAALDPDGDADDSAS